MEATLISQYFLTLTSVKVGPERWNIFGEDAIRHGWRRGLFFHRRLPGEGRREIPSSLIAHVHLEKTTKKKNKCKLN